MSRADDYLLFSVEKGHFEHTRKALKMGAFVNVRDYDGKTALMYAIENKHAKIIEMLKSHGATE